MIFEKMVFFGYFPKFWKNFDPKIFKIFKIPPKIPYFRKSNFPSFFLKLVTFEKLEIFDLRLGLI